MACATPGLRRLIGHSGRAALLVAVLAPVAACDLNSLLNGSDKMPVDWQYDLFSPPLPDGASPDMCPMPQLQLMPSSAFVTLPASGSAPMPLRALVNCVDATASVQMTLSDPHFTVTGGNLVVSRPGECAGQLTVNVRTATEAVGGTVNVSDQVPPSFLNGAPQTAAGYFNGPVSGLPSEVAAFTAPINGTQVSASNPPLISWTAPADQVLWQLQIASMYASTVLYVGPQGCSRDAVTGLDNCQLQPPAAIWYSMVCPAAGYVLSISLVGTSGLGGTQSPSTSITLAGGP